MDIRIMGSREECEQMGELFAENMQLFKTVTVSRLYPNRPPSNEFRIYIKVQFTENSKNTALKRL